MKRVRRGDGARRGRALAAALWLCACGHLGGEDTTASSGGTGGSGGTGETGETAGPEVSEMCQQLPTLCAGDDVTAPSFSDPVQIAPSAALPPEVRSRNAHNNLDVAWHQGRLYFAFRTAPTHFASADARMYVVSSADLETWQFEIEVALGTDVREPQLLSSGDVLHFYFAVLGDNPLSFDPMGNRHATFTGGVWSEPVDLFDSDFIPWRIKTVDGAHYLLGYTGGAGVYDPDAPPIEVHWLRSEDGASWGPVLADQEVVLTGGSSETDFVFTPEGGVVAVSRNEAGDEFGFGTKLCKAGPDDLGSWACVADPRRYDSPLLFVHGAREIYLIGRRNLTETGAYDLMREDLDPEDQYWEYQVDYWTHPKRCALWRVDAESLAVEHVTDLPSRGDTCFPEILPLSDRRYLVFNYTSPLDGPDITWQEGQMGKTSIYYSVLSMPAPVSEE